MFVTDCIKEFTDYGETVPQLYASIDDRPGSPAELFELMKGNQMQHVFNDGGREAAGYKGHAGDCVCRAIAIAGQLSYQDVYNLLAEGNASQRRTKHSKKSTAGVRTAARGINTKRKWFKELMADLGATWHPTCQIGLGAAPISSLPTEGRLMVAFRRHYAAVIDGVLHDTWDATYGYDRVVYGYWKF